MRNRLGTAILLGLALSSCAGDAPSKYERDGVRYGVTEGVFHGRWWNYYERGSSFLSGGFYEEALSDFETARTGRARDTWRARTYGLHFTEYFPNRERGVALFHLGRLDEAEAALTAALAEVDTARGHYYLDLVKRERIKRGQLQDAGGPAVQVSVGETVLLARRGLAASASSEGEKATRTVVTERALGVAVAAQDDTGVTAVSVNGEGIPQRGSAAAVSASKGLTLSEGTHTVTVAAKDLADNEVTAQVEVTVDLTGPTIGVFAPIEPTVTPEGTVILEGATVDKNGVAAVRVDDKVLAESPGAPKLAFSSELPLAEGENTFVLAARDVAGNETRSAVKVFKGDPNSREAKLWLLRQKYPEGFLVADASFSALHAMLAATPTPAVEIRVKSPAEDRPYRHNQTLRVSGEVLMASNVTSLRINGEPLGDLVGAPKESFNKRIPIDAESIGDTVQVAIAATDSTGATIEKTVTVQVRPVEVNTPDTKMPVAVLAFAGNKVDTTETEYLRVSTEERLSKGGRFRVLDRTRLQEVLTEQQLASALSHPSEAIALGRLTNAQVFLIADVFPHDAAGLEIKARVVSTETSEVISTLDAYIEDRNNRGIVGMACESLAMQLAKLYPRLSGEVLDARGNTLLLNWTQEDGVRPGAYVLLMKEEPPWIDEATGEVLEAGQFVAVGRARIESATTSSTRAVAVEQKEEGVSLEKGMPALTM